MACTLGKWEKGKLNPQEAEEKKQYLEQKIGETETRKSRDKSTKQNLVLQKKLSESSVLWFSLSEERDDTKG